MSRRALLDTHTHTHTHVLNMCLSVRHFHQILQQLPERTQQFACMRIWYGKNHLWDEPLPGIQRYVCLDQSHDSLNSILDKAHVLNQIFSCLSICTIRLDHSPQTERAQCFDTASRSTGVPGRVYNKCLHSPQRPRPSIWPLVSKWVDSDMWRLEKCSSFSL